MAFAFESCQTESHIHREVLNLPNSQCIQMAPLQPTSFNTSAAQPARKKMCSDINTQVQLAATADLGSVITHWHSQANKQSQHDTHPAGAGVGGGRQDVWLVIDLYCRERPETVKQSLGLCHHNCFSLHDILFPRIYCDKRYYRPF